MRLLHRLLCTAFLAVAFFSFSSRDMLAQTPPPGVTCPTGWLLMMEPFPNTLMCSPPTTEDLEVWFCIPDPSGPITPKEQIVIKAIRILGGGGLPCPNPLSGTAVRQFGEIIMFDRNPGGWTVPVNCSPWCLEHPECPCPALYPQWVASNGSCGKIVPDASGTNIVMCGEVDVPGQNCYYSYQVCKRPNGQTWKRWVGKQISLNCPGTSGDPECSMPLCDGVNDPEEPTGDPCEESTITVPEQGLSSVEPLNNGDNVSATPVPRTSDDKGARKENE